MGAGDWLICTARIKALHEKTRVPVIVFGLNGRLQWSEVFEGNPRVLRRPNGRPYQKLIDGHGARPYVAGKTDERWTWKQWDIQPGELYLAEREKQFAAPHAGRVLVEPNTKGTNEGNKAWLWDRWQALVDRREHEYLQIGPVGARRLDGVPFVLTPTFRAACAVLAASRAFVGTEGGLGHAAAALGVPAVILWSEFIEPRYTGYPAHRNLRHAGPACGMRKACAGCRASMLAISVDEVAENLNAITFTAKEEVA